jgi:hypothetical protein
LEFVERATTIEAPYAYFKYDQSRDIVAESQWADEDAKLQLISIGNVFILILQCPYGSASERSH